MGKEVLVRSDVVPTSNPDITAIRDIFRNDRGELTEKWRTRDGRVLSSSSIATINQSGSSLAQAKLAAKSNRDSLNFKKFEVGYIMVKELIPVIGSIILFAILLGFGSAGLNYAFEGNNIYYFVGIILALLFFVKKKNRR